MYDHEQFVLMNIKSKENIQPLESGGGHYWTFSAKIRLSRFEISWYSVYPD